MTSHRPHSVAYTLNVLLPGAGNLYLGQTLIGVLLCSFCAISVFLFFFGASAALLGILVLVISIVGAFFTFGLTLLIGLPIGLLLLMMGAGPIVAFVTWLLSLVISEVLVHRAAGGEGVLLQLRSNERAQSLPATKPIAPQGHPTLESVGMAEAPRIGTRLEHPGVDSKAHAVVARPSVRRDAEGGIESTEHRLKYAVLPCGALAVLSGVLSAYFFEDPWNLVQLNINRRLPWAFSTSVNLPPVPLLPGLYFGLSVCMGIGVLALKAFWQYIVLFLGVVVAWVIAFEVYYVISFVVEQKLVVSEPSIALHLSRRAGPIAGFFAGLVGSAITFEASRLVTDRITANVLQTAAIGALAGYLLVGGGSSFLLLFIVWQSAVLMSISYSVDTALTSARRSDQSSGHDRTRAFWITTGALAAAGLATFVGQYSVEAQKYSQASAKSDLNGLRMYLESCVICARKKDALSQMFPH